MLTPGWLPCWLLDSLILTGACALGLHRKKSQEKGGNCLLAFLGLAM